MSNIVLQTLKEENGILVAASFNRLIRVALTLVMTLAMSVIVLP